MNLKDNLEVLTNKFQQSIMEIAIAYIGNKDFSDIVIDTEKEVNRLGCQILQAIITEVDRTYNSNRDRHAIVIKNRTKIRRMLTPMGDIEIHRTLYFNKKANRYFFAVDEILRLEKYSRIESTMQAKIVQNAAITSYGKASSLAGHRISRQTAYNVTQRLRNVEAKVPEKGLKYLKDLYIEADEDHIHLKNGKASEVKLVYVHEGSREVCKDRKELINPRYFVAVDEDPDDIWNNVAQYITNHYSCRSCKVHISGDGAPWIRAGERVLSNAQYHIDKFHIQKAATNIAKGNRNVRSGVMAAMRYNKPEKLAALCRQQYQICQRHTERRTVAENYLYLRDNLPYYGSKVTCSAEGHISHVLSARMSSRPMAWTKDGAERVGKLRAFLFNKGDFLDLVKNGKRSESVTDYPKKSADHFDKLGGGEVTETPVYHVAGLEATSELQSMLKYALKIC